MTEGREKLDSLASQLEKLRSQNTALGEKKSKLEGRLETLTSTLTEKFGVTTVEDAKKKLESMETEIDTLSAEIADKMGKVRGYLDSVQ